MTPAPTLEFAFEMRVQVAPPIMVGMTTQGERRIGMILGGSFEGPAIKGTILPGGADWQTVRSDGVFELDARLTLVTDDGAHLVLFNRGLRHGPPEVLARLARGEPVDPSEYYFRTTADISAPVNSGHDWLCRSLLIGQGMRTPDAAVNRFFRVM